MPSVRTEMRVSHKLAPDIVGPSLETATEILHSAYSRRTREAQQVMGCAESKDLHVCGSWPPGCVGMYILAMCRKATGFRAPVVLPRSPAAHSSSRK